MKHTHHRDERPEESRARMFLTDNNDMYSSTNLLRRKEMKHTHHRDERLEEGRARMYLSDRDDWRSGTEAVWARDSIEKTILSLLENTETSMSDIVLRLLGEGRLQAPSDLRIIGEALQGLYKRGEIVITGFVPNQFSPRDLEVRIRRAGDFKNKPGTVC